MLYTHKIKKIKLLHTSPSYTRFIRHKITSSKTEETEISVDMKQLAVTLNPSRMDGLMCEELNDFNPF